VRRRRLARQSNPVEKIQRPNADSAMADTELEAPYPCRPGQLEANCDYGFVQPLEKFQPNIFLMGSITMEKDLKTSEESKTPEMRRGRGTPAKPRLGCRGIARSNAAR